MTDDWLTFSETVIDLARVDSMRPTTRVAPVCTRPTRCLGEYPRMRRLVPV